MHQLPLAEANGDSNFVRNNLIINDVIPLHLLFKKFKMQDASIAVG